MTVTSTPIHAGPGALDYFLRQQGCAERDRAVELEREGPERAAEGHQHEDQREAEHDHGGRGEAGGLGYYTEAAGREDDGEQRGEPAGVWMGSGLSEFGFVEGEAIVEEDARAVFERLEHPKTGEALGSRHRKYKSADQRYQEALEREPDATPERKDELKWQTRGAAASPVGYWDHAFSAPKSVSVLYAVLAAEGRTEDAEKVWAAHREGVRAGLAYLEDKAGWSRRGYHGKAPDGRSVGEWVKADRWTVVRFDHTTSRTGDPQIHSHAVCPNRVPCADTDKAGQPKWRSLDGRGFYQAKRATDAVYQRRMFEALQRDLGVSAVARADGNGWEIEGISREVCEAYSSRHGQVEEKAREYIRSYTETHGRAPEARELFMIYKTASLNSRPPKPEPKTPAEHHQQWTSEPAWDRTRDEAERSVPETAHEAPQRATGFDRSVVIAEAVAEVQERRASWTAEDLRAAIDTKLPIDSSIPAAPRDDLLAGLVAEAVAPGGANKVVGLVPPEPVVTPAAARRAQDGLSRFERPMPERYATEGQLAAEDQLSAAAARGGAPVLAPSQIEALRGEIAESGLNSGQRAAVEGILGSDQQIDVLIGPAGTGKSFTVAALSQVWQREHQAPVLGLATSQVATDVLREDGLDAINTTKFLQTYEPDPVTGLAADVLTPGTLLIVDETGMAATAALNRIRSIAEAAGAKLLFTGDHEQLDAVGAGGALRQLAGEVPTFTLDEVVRFSNDWEREASLGLREGRADVLRDYDTQGRLFEGDEQAMLGQAKDMFLATRLRGEASLLIVPRNDQAATLSGELRAQLQAYGVVSTDDAATTVLRDDNLAGVGDLIQTRRNDWKTRTTGGRPVINRDLWRVVDRGEDGSLRVEKVDARGRADAGAGEVTLSQSYLAESATLAYAVTNHAAQGVTVGQSINLFELASTRSHIYVGMTRGRDGNWAFVITRAEADHDRYLEPLRSDRYKVLTHGLEQDTAQRTATDTLRAELDRAEGIAQLGVAWRILGEEQNRDRYADILVPLLGPAGMDRLDDEHGADRFYRSVRSAELAGRMPERLLPQLVAKAPLGDARSISDVLRHRLHVECGEAPQPVTASWVGRTHGVDAAARGGELGRFRVELAAAMDRREQALGDLAAENPPVWAQSAPGLGEVPKDPIARAEWVARAGAVAGAREWIGAADLPETVALGPAPSRENPDARAVWERAWAALGAPVEQRDYARASDAALQRMVTRYRREQAWAPDYVADLLRSTEQRRVRYQTWATLEAQRLTTLTDPTERAASQNRLSQHEGHVTRQTERRDALHEIHDARQAWFAETAVARHHSEHASRELARRQVAVPQRVPDPETTDPETERQPEPATATGQQQPDRAQQQEQRAAADERTPQQRYTDLTARAREAEQARAQVHHRFVEQTREAHTQRLAQLDPDQALDQQAREAAVRADNLTRAAAAVRAEHGHRLDPDNQRDDTDLLHARAYEITTEREAAAADRAPAREHAHDQADPERVLSEHQRDALAWHNTRHQREQAQRDQQHQHDDAQPATREPERDNLERTTGPAPAQSREPVSPRQRDDGTPERATSPGEQATSADRPGQHRAERDTHAGQAAERSSAERGERQPEQPQPEQEPGGDQRDTAGRGGAGGREPERGGATGPRYRTSADVQAGLERARAARENVEARRAARTRQETERHDQRNRHTPETTRERQTDRGRGDRSNPWSRAERQTERGDGDRNPWARSEQQRNPYDRER